MAFLRLKNRGDDPDIGLTSKKPGPRWVAVPAAGVALALWSMATMAGLSSLGSSLTAASNNLPPNLLAPSTIALADPRRAIANSWAMPLSAGAPHRQALLGRCDAGCVRRAPSFAHDGKMARLAPARPDSVATKTAQPKALAIATSAGNRFDSVVAGANLSPQKLAAAFARAQNAPSLLASLPAEARFAGAARMPDQNGPASVRFGPEVAEVERSSRLALALASALPEADMLAPPSSVTAVAAPDLAANTDHLPAESSHQGEVQVASLPPQQNDLIDSDLPDSMAAPALRRRAETDQPREVPKAEAPRAEAPRVEPLKAQAGRGPASKAQTADAPQAPAPSPSLSPRSSEQVAVPGMQASQGKPAKPGKRSKTQASEVLAYAKPDMPERGAGGVFGNLFSNAPSAGNGVAVYDISARTVYMPDGSRLEAHSGLGSMVDQPRFVNKKNVGPTPPDTYNLSLRESRFHGVEAIRLTPTSGSNKYGRDGLLAHTYMLRGGRAESNGCVVFRDYARFLAAYKKGKIKRLVVVPRMSKPLTRVAQEGRAG